MFERDDAQLCRLGVLHLLASSSPHFHTPPFRKLCCIQAHSLDTLFQPRVDIRTATKERSATNQPQPNNHKHSTRETRQKNRTHQHQNRSKYQDIDTQYQDTFGKNIYIPKHSTIILTRTFLPAGNRPPQHRTTHGEEHKYNQGPPETTNQSTAQKYQRVHKTKSHQRRDLY